MIPRRGRRHPSTADLGRGIGRHHHLPQPTLLEIEGGPRAPPRAGRRTAGHRVPEGEPDAGRHRALMVLLGIKYPKAMMRTGEPAFRELALGDANDDELIDAMVAHPILIERPDHHQGRPGGHRPPARAAARAPRPARSGTPRQFRKTRESFRDAGFGPAERWGDIRRVENDAGSRIPAPARNHVTQPNHPHRTRRSSPPPAGSTRPGRSQLQEQRRVELVQGDDPHPGQRPVEAAGVASRSKISSPASMRSAYAALDELAEPEHGHLAARRRGGRCTWGRKSASCEPEHHVRRRGRRSPRGCAGCPRPRPRPTAGPTAGWAGCPWRGGPG